MSPEAVTPRGDRTPRTVVVSGGTDGMGRALALGRAARGDTVVVLGSNREKGERVLEEAARLDGTGALEFERVDLSSIDDTRAAVRRIAARHEAVDALTLFANRQAPRRTVTADGLEQVFAVYYLSRYLLSYELSPLLRRSRTPVIVNVAGVGMTKGRLHWDDLQLEGEGEYGMVAAQLQAARANDLLGVMFAAEPDNPVPYVLYHPGFTKSGDLTPLRPALRVTLRALAALAARPVERAVAPLHRFIEEPPRAPLSAIDRETSLPLSLRTLDPHGADRLAAATRAILAAHEGTVSSA
ncbi:MULTISPECIES: SDR family NAD(P)-dependent oxidoreductase [Mumia]|uniref:SDR family NAD(P)-dependent oxidoreductase n=1 Tax=Mumia TaxID=1546255 RepID=UPI0014211EE4|nr:MULTISPECIES: SDR family NAD(P)-dependent oxidoreductase [unclassified Mumia]QMW65253.1 SDR family NAD(P)-dependent oxidoreductase [Mumia sp. ZJ1417]